MRKLKILSLFFNATKGKEAFTTIQNNLVEITLDNKGGRVYSALLKNYMGQDKKPVVLFNGSDASMNFNFYNKKGALQTKDFYFEAVNKTDSSVTMRLAADSASYIDFIYTLKPDNYLMSFVIKATGMDGKLAASTNYTPYAHQECQRDEKGGDNRQPFHDGVHPKIVIGYIKIDKGRGDFPAAFRCLDNELELVLQVIIDRQDIRGDNPVLCS